MSSVAAVALLLGGCTLLSEFSPGAEDSAVEIALRDGTCWVGVGTVLAGVHPVFVYSDTRGAGAQIFAPDGTVVFEGDALFSEDDGAIDSPRPPVSAAPPTDKSGYPQGPVQLDAGTYRVECIGGSGEKSSAELRVK